MKYIIKTHKQVYKFLEKHREVAKRYVLAIDELELNPYDNSLDNKPHSWKENHYRFRKGRGIIGYFPPHKLVQ